MANWNEEELKNQIKEVIKYSQDFNKNEPKVEAIYNKWLKNKKYFIKQLNGELIYEHPEPISFEMSEKDKIRSVEDFMTDIEFEYNSLKNISSILSFFDFCKKDIYKNNLQKDFIFEDYQGTKKVIKKGIKINKALKFFFIPEEKELLTNLQIAVSRLIQKNKVCGKLCISVHPLDYLSSSENTYNWRTCHSLDGEYKTGNLSYMVDKSTLICYLKSDNKYKLPNFPSSVKWNNKKWRVLIHISNDKKLVFAGRQYPFFSMEGLNLIKEKLLNKKNWTEWNNNFIDSFKFSNGTNINLNNKYMLINFDLKPINEVVISGVNSLNFNDVLDSHFYTPYYSYAYNSYFANDDTKVEIGESVPCLYCEEKDIPYTDLFRCVSCEEKCATELHEDFYICQICGKIKHINSMRYCFDGQQICTDCIKENNYSICDNCGEYIIDEKDIRKEGNKIYCPECYKWRIL